MSVTSLPRDRLSQVTRRGMLTDTKSHSKLHTASQGEERQRKMASGGTAVGRGIQREQTRMEEKEEKDAVNLWEASSESKFNIVRMSLFIHNLPKSDESDLYCTWKKTSNDCLVLESRIWLISMKIKILIVVLLPCNNVYTFLLIDDG